MNMTAEKIENTDDEMNRRMRQFCPPLEFGDTPEISDGGDDSALTQSGEADDGASESTGDESNPNQYGFVPCYRSFRDKWFWQEKPWDVAHLFMELLMRVNRTPRMAKHAGKVQLVARGQAATSKMKLAEVTGRNPKTVTRWLKNLEASGEIKVKNLGRSGILITVCQYGIYALDKAKPGEHKGRETGHPKGQRHG